MQLQGPLSSAPPSPPPSLPTPLPPSPGLRTHFITDGVDPVSSWLLLSMGLPRGEGNADLGPCLSTGSLAAPSPSVLALASFPFLPSLLPSTPGREVSFSSQDWEGRPGEACSPAGTGLGCGVGISCMRAAGRHAAGGSCFPPGLPMAPGGLQTPGKVSASTWEWGKDGRGA